MTKLKTTERGWAGHFICYRDCLFRRNTLLEYGNIKIVVSTIGLMIDRETKKPNKIGLNRYYETMVFFAKENDEYDDADVTRQIVTNSKWAICKMYAEIEANKMHDSTVKDVSCKILRREKFTQN